MGNMQKITARIQTLPGFANSDIPVHILRLDELHPVISGNKWFKLQHYLSAAEQQGAQTIASFGGAYSNHIVATAFAAREKGLNSAGFIRGEVSASQPALDEAASYGMQLYFVNRDTYRNKTVIMEQHRRTGWYWIPEGGYGIQGAEGAADILSCANTSSYTHILCAAGTGTMTAGLVKAAGPAQQVVSVAILKHPALENDIRALLAQEEQQKPLTVLHDYHCGGYAKHPPSLLGFMQELWERYRLPTDIVYTSKLLYAADTLVKQDYFPQGSSLLLVHSGGLQGNRSLSANSLPF
jgi:1-aminocyclopropane-1-carboxylate deaminase